MIRVIVVVKYVLCGQHLLGKKQPFHTYVDFNIEIKFSAT